MTSAFFDERKERNARGTQKPLRREQKWRVMISRPVVQRRNPQELSMTKFQANSEQCIINN
ncbi:hypothetical protein P5673_009932 [Acropora cervicornis]|uniref:Uncharacterized protein n=1 Tax=Acropora cervicornis TaxID=6130 RepID=A0AAD9VA52_ACRCE|nr:hypothetical protein P5673_009932 [Acropora cervicornis]